jgi:2-polyprenyl-6-methoxyphenol hydroxylase-like FAD-dependent oxidoreductase
MKIVIVGAGITGCTAYLALRKHLPKPSGSSHDHEYTIYEAYDVSKDDFREKQEHSTHSSTLIVGGGLGIGPNGLNVLERLDESLVRDITRGGYAYSRSNMKSKHGRTLMSGDASVGSNPPMNSLGSSRQSMWRCLKNRIPEGVIVNKRVSQVEANTEGRNIVRFVDGSPPVEADLVIGADGLRTTVKKALFPDAKEDLYPPRYE